MLQKPWVQSSLFRKVWRVCFEYKLKDTIICTTQRQTHSYVFCMQTLFTQGHNLIIFVVCIMVSVNISYSVKELQWGVAELDKGCRENILSSYWEMTVSRSSKPVSSYSAAESFTTLDYSATNVNIMFSLRMWTYLTQTEIHLIYQVGFTINTVSKGERSLINVWPLDHAISWKNVEFSEVTRPVCWKLCDVAATEIWVNR